MAGVAEVGETPSLTEEFAGKWGYSQAGELHCSLSGHSPMGRTTVQQGGLPCPGEYLSPRPLTTYQVRPDKEIWPK